MSRNFWPVPGRQCPHHIVDDFTGFFRLHLVRPDPDTNHVGPNYLFGFKLPGGINAIGTVLTGEIAAGEVFPAAHHPATGLTTFRNHVVTSKS
jgi:hypothetical protein